MAGNITLDTKQHWEDVRSRTAPACVECVHWKTGTDLCKAFHDGIPDAILFQGNPHTTPYPGDNGIRFEPLTEAQGPGVTN